MKLQPILFSILFMFATQIFAQNSLKKCNTKIDNDLYFLSIAESSGIFLPDGKVLKDASSKKQNRDGTDVEFLNYNLDKIIEFALFEKEIRVINKEIEKHRVNLIYKVKNFSGDESKLILWSNISSCFGLKSTKKNKEVEKWVWELGDSTLLKKAVNINKDNTPKKWGENVSSLLFGENRWESKKNNLNIASKDLAKNLKIEIKNRIISKETYDIILSVPEKYSLEEIQAQLLKYGILMKFEKIEEEYFEIE